MTIRVLIAEDHVVVSEGLKLLLEIQPDIKVTGIAVNGTETIRMVKALKPDVVLMDITMPDLNGIEATRRIQAELPGVKVVILSMHSSSEHVYHALQAGALGYLVKEAAGEEVIAAVRSVFAGIRYLSAKIEATVIDDYLKRSRASTKSSPLESLTSRDREVLQLICEGRSTAEVAEKLSLSIKTVETYRSRLMHRLDIHDIPSLVKFAIQNGLISLE
jgi:DNA-binding NarL/FixJ family response regulator